jgi:hypothetical protein
MCDATRLARHIPAKITLLLSADFVFYRWLWTRTPIAKIGYSIFIYDMTGRPDDLRRLKDTYRKGGIPAPP